MSKEEWFYHLAILFASLNFSSVNCQGNGTTLYVTSPGVTHSTPGTLVNGNVTTQVYHGPIEYSSGSGVLEQVGQSRYCIQMRWFGYIFYTLVLQLTVTNNRTQTVTTVTPSSTVSDITVCSLDETQSYLVQLTDPGWASRRHISRYMWTQHATPACPTVPEIESVSDKTITINIFPTSIDLNRGPFSGFDIRVLRVDRSGSDGFQDNEHNNNTNPNPNTYVYSTPGVSAGFLTKNEQQTFVIGLEENLMNKQLDKDSEYLIYLGVVSTVAQLTTHCYVRQISGSTVLINIHVIVMFLCFVVGILLLAHILTYMIWKRKVRDQAATRRNDEKLMYLTEMKGVEKFGVGDGKLMIGVIGDPEAVAPYIPAAKT